MHRHFVPALVLLALPGLLASAAMGQCEPNDVSAVFSTTPERPTSRDDGLTLTFFGSSAGCAPELVSVERQEDLFIVHATQPEEDCGGAPASYRVEAATERLRSGTYRARFEIDNRSCVFPERTFEVESGGLKVGEGPAATLLFPYFEVDLANPRGDTTTLGIGNASDRPVVANAVLWTDMGIPTLAFPFEIGAGRVEPISLRTVFAEGRLPPNHCIQGILDPPDPEPRPFFLGEAERAALVAAHTGQPHPADGLCYASGRTGDQVATGYVTVDVIEHCASTVPPHDSMFPTSEGYFSDLGSLRIASDRNALWGDLYQIDDEGNNAQGLEAVGIPTDADVGNSTFYRRFSSGEDRRVPLGHHYRARFLNGGGFQGATDVIVWLDGFESEREPFPCGEPPPVLCHVGTVQLFDQAGNAEPELPLPFLEGTGMLPIGGPDLPTDLPFGSVEIANYLLDGCLIIPTGLVPLQAWVGPVLRAGGRFSIGLRATRID